MASVTRSFSESSGDFESMSRSATLITNSSTRSDGSDYSRTLSTSSSPTDSSLLNSPRITQVESHQLRTSSDTVIDVAHGPSTPFKPRSFSIPQKTETFVVWQKKEENFTEERSVFWQDRIRDYEAFPERFPNGLELKAISPEHLEEIKSYLNTTSISFIVSSLRVLMFDIQVELQANDRDHLREIKKCLDEIGISFSINGLIVSVYTPSLDINASLRERYDNLLISNTEIIQIADVVLDCFIEAEPLDRLIFQHGLVKEKFEYIENLVEKAKYNFDVYEKSIEGLMEDAAITSEVVICYEKAQSEIQGIIATIQKLADNILPIEERLESESFYFTILCNIIVISQLIKCNRKYETVLGKIIDFHQTNRKKGLTFEENT